MRAQTKERSDAASPWRAPPFPGLPLTLLSRLSLPSPRRGWTPIYDASLHAHAEVLAVMLKAGARTDGRDMLGYGPDHYCAKEGLWEKVTAK